MFTWDEKSSESNTIIYKKHSYKVVASKIWGNYRIDLLEDDIEVILENSANETFLNKVVKSDSIELQILTWADKILLNNYGICDCCSEEKLVFELAEYDKEYCEFISLNKICKKCRDTVYSKISQRLDKEISKEHDELEAFLEVNPPVIVGGFIKRIEAYKYLITLPEKSIEKIDEDFIYAKAILKANDDTYYPVFCVIDKSSGGEHWDTQFVSENLDEYIPQDLVFPYINKEINAIIPYTYETLSVIEEDFHQNNWFGDITRKNVKHHLSNMIHINSSNNIEDSKNIEDLDNDITVRTYFSIQHLLSVSLYRKEIKKLEKKLSKNYYEIDFLKHRSLCTSSIFSAVSFLEATINEFYSDAYDNTKGIVRDLSDEDICLLAKMWGLGIPRTAGYNIIEKYQIALSLCKKDKIDLGITPGQDISALIKLRNALVHYEPEWVVTKNNDQLKNYQRLEKQLKYKFKLNSYTGECNPFFPDKCLSYGCIDWAFKNIISFTDDFFISLDIVPPYEKVRFKLENINIII